MFKKVNQADLTAIENMLSDIHNDYVARIHELEKDNSNLKKDRDKALCDWGKLAITVEKKDNEIEKLKKQLDLSQKANNVLKDCIESQKKTIKELKCNEIMKETILDFCKDCRELLLKANSVSQENHRLKAVTKKDLALEKFYKVPKEVKERLK